MFDQISNNNEACSVDSVGAVNSNSELFGFVLWVSFQICNLLLYLFEKWLCIFFRRNRPTCTSKFLKRNLWAPILKIVVLFSISKIQNSLNFYLFIIFIKIKQIDNRKSIIRLYDMVVFLIHWNFKRQEKYLIRNLYGPTIFFNWKPIILNFRNCVWTNNLVGIFTYDFIAICLKYF